MKKNIILVILILIVVKGFSDPVEITQNTTWNNLNDLNQYAALGQYANEGISIYNNSTLTIKIGSNGTNPLLMDMHAYILVEIGSKLIVDGGHISNIQGNGYWEGIYAFGDGSQDQIFSGGSWNQGYVEIKNEAIIKGANTGVLADGGAILKVFNNAQFVNCEVSVYMDRYLQSTHRSFIKNSSFVWNVDYELSSLEKFIYLGELNCIEIEGNTFLNDHPTKQYTGTGIYSENSNFIASSYGITWDGNCKYTAGIPNSFRDLAKGIFINNSEYNGYWARILDNEFLDNVIGIDVNNGCDLILYRNNFTWRDLNADCKGVALKGWTDFEFNQNNFIWDLATCTPNEYIGIFSQNYSSISKEEVYKNKFEVLSINCYDPPGPNPSFNGIEINSLGTSIQLNCNRFLNMSGCLYMYHTQAILFFPDQGNLWTSAGNTFTNTQNSDISVQNINQFAYCYNSSSQPSGGNFILVNAFNPNLCQDVSGCDMLGISPVLSPVSTDPIKEETSEKSLNVYPNPSVSDFKISYSTNNESNTNIQITNSLGQVVYMKQVSDSEGVIDIHKSSIGNAGIYLCSIIVNGTIENQKKVIILD